jgi:hypothetical protein
VLPEETVYSIWARYGAFGPPTSLRSISKEVLGLSTVSVAIDLPTNLRRLAASLGKDLRISAEELLFDHTLFPMYALFLTAAQRDSAIAAMMDHGHPHLCCGISPSGLAADRCLLCCRKCMRADRALAGFSVWRRVTQAPGVLVCPQHGDALLLTNVRPSALNASPVLLTADEALMGESVPFEDSGLPTLAAIAADVAWLLHNQTFPGPERLHSIYYDKLRDLGLLRLDGSIRMHDLTHGILNKFGPALLTRLKVPLSPDQRDNWVERLARRPRYTQAPLRHILFWRFLGLDAQQVIKLGAVATAINPHGRPRPHPNRIRNLAKSIRDAKRAEWLSLLRHSDGTPLRTEHENLYSWMWRNDRVWLHAHRPAWQRLPERRIDWQAWDARLTRLVHHIALELRMQTHPCVRVTRNRIASATDKRAWLVGPNPRLPHASRLIDELVETAEAFAVRRIASVVCQIGGQRMPVWKLRVAAGIGAPLARQPAVQAALSAASLAGTGTVAVP